jgi:regulator of PEP synthase PpsR (kinase-PPPase family)
VLRAALAQFVAGDVIVRRRPQTRTVEQIQQVVVEAHESGSMLVHTLAIHPAAAGDLPPAVERSVHSVDLLGNLLSDLSAYRGAPPGGVPGGLHRFDENHHARPTL